MSRQEHDGKGSGIRDEGLWERGSRVGKRKLAGMKLFLVLAKLRCVYNDAGFVGLS